MKEIFVFGSNRAGVHGMGAALDARRVYGAEHGVGEGMTGCCYALPTKNTPRSAMSLAEVSDAINRFLDFARKHDELSFRLTKVGCGLAGFQLGVTVENKRSGLRRLDQLRDIPARIRFLSVEPLLEDLGSLNLTGISWVIIGGESGTGYRPMDQAWADSVIAQCRDQNVPVFFKQWGGFRGGSCVINGREIKEWPEPFCSSKFANG